MHPHHHCRDRLRLFDAGNPRPQPIHLCRIECIPERVVHRDEIHVVHDPVVVGARAAGILVGRALRAQSRTIDVAGELPQEVLARPRPDGLMISNAEKYLERAEWFDLLVEEVRPGALQIIGHRTDRRHVFIDRIHRAEIAEMPVETRLALEHTQRNRRHHDVTAVPGIAGDCELPHRGGPILRERRRRQQKNKCQFHSITASVISSRRFGVSPSTSSSSNASRTYIPPTIFPNAEYCPSRFSAVPSTMKKEVVAEFGSSPCAIDTIPRTCLKSLRNSPLTECTHRSALCTLPGAVPPCTTNPFAMRWNTVPFNQPLAVSIRKLRTFSGAQSGCIWIRRSPSVVFTRTILRISSGVAVRNGCTFFGSMVTLRMRTGVSVMPSGLAGTR